MLTIAWNLAVEGIILQAYVYVEFFFAYTERYEESSLKWRNSSSLQYYTVFWKSNIFFAAHLFIVIYKKQLSINSEC